MLFLEMLKIHKNIKAHTEGVSTLIPQTATMYLPVRLTNNTKVTAKLLVPFTQKLRFKVNVKAQLD